jgi:hypothetical protein
MFVRRAPRGELLWAVPAEGTVCAIDVADFGVCTARLCEDGWTWAQETRDPDASETLVETTEGGDEAGSDGPPASARRDAGRSEVLTARARVGCNPRGGTAASLAETFEALRRSRERTRPKRGAPHAGRCYGLAAQICSGRALARDLQEALARRAGRHDKEAAVVREARRVARRERAAGDRLVGMMSMTAADIPNSAAPASAAPPTAAAGPVVSRTGDPTDAPSLAAASGGPGRGSQRDDARRPFVVQASRPLADGTAELPLPPWMRRSMSQRMLTEFGFLPPQFHNSAARDDPVAAAAERSRNGFRAAGAAPPRKGRLPEDVPEAARVVEAGAFSAPGGGPGAFMGDRTAAMGFDRAAVATAARLMSRATSGGPSAADRGSEPRGAEGHEIVRAESGGDGRLGTLKTFAAWLQQDERALAELPPFRPTADFDNASFPSGKPEAPLGRPFASPRRLGRPRDGSPDHASPGRSYGLEEAPASTRFGPQRIQRLPSKGTRHLMDKRALLRYFGEHHIPPDRTVERRRRRRSGSRSESPKIHHHQRRRSSTHRSGSFSSKAGVPATARKRQSPSVGQGNQHSQGWAVGIYSDEEDPDM